MKKFISLILALALTLTLIPSAFAAGTTIVFGEGAENASNKFTDVPNGAWYLGELNYAVANGFISGTSATTFSPDATITRCQFVTILGRLVNAPTSGGSTKFTDVDAGSWYAPYVAWAVEKGFVNGTSSTTFSPDANITVEQIGTILANYISKSGVVMSSNPSSWLGDGKAFLELTGVVIPSSYPSYRDASSVSSWAASSLGIMQKYGLLVTDELGRVRPHKAVTRAEATVSLVRFAWGAGIGEKPSMMDSTIAFMGKPEVCDDETYFAVVKAHDELLASGKLTSSMTQKAKARAYYDWLIAHCEYDWSLQHESVHDAFVVGKATCMGYAGAYQLLLALEDIECGFVASFSGDHMWNTAVLDGVTYHIDATWGDSQGNADKYFCMTEEAAWARFGGKPAQSQNATVETPEIDWTDFEFGTLEDGETGTFVNGDFEW